MNRITLLKHINETSHLPTTASLYDLWHLIEGGFVDFADPLAPVQPTEAELVLTTLGEMELEDAEIELAEMKDNPLLPELEARMQRIPSFVQHGSHRSRVPFPGEPRDIDPEVRDFDPLDAAMLDGQRAVLTNEQVGEILRRNIKR